MAKNIVVFSDGTGNSAAKVFKTNVWRMYQALDLSTKDQIAAYDDGVGTSSFRPLAILGGALGVGLARNVKHLYAFICRNYEDGDKLYAFGFSRGAFTIRILAGLLCDQGILPRMPERDLERHVANAYRAFRRRFNTTGGLVGPLRSVRDGVLRLVDRLRGRTLYEQLTRLEEVPIDFLGLWDTVDAYGLPIDEMTRAVDLYFWPLSMRERNLSPLVQRACHALALDDERQTFHPVLWNEEHEPIRANIEDERITQVWFTGMHANVGGGYADDGLSYVPLAWMLDRAAARGLRFKPHVARQIHAAAAASLDTIADELKRDATPFGRMYDSRQGAGSYYRYDPRSVEALTNDTTDETNKVVIKRPKIHESVFRRIREGNDRYAPIVLPPSYAVVDESGAIVDLNRSGYETTATAAARHERQEAVWNLVARRRRTYFGSLLVTAVAVLMPLMMRAKTDGAAPGPFALLSPVIGAAGMLLPSLATPWIAVYRSYPWLLLVIGALLGALTAKSRSLQVEIEDRMRGVWQHVTGEPGSGDAPPPSSSVRTSKSRRAAADVWKRTYAPALFALLFALVGVFGFNRAMIAMVGAFGCVCTPASGSQDIKGDAHADGFATSNPCWSSGFKLKEGTRYRVKLTTGESWADKGREANVRGVQAPSFMMYLGVPLRRQIGQPWFQPIARIGATGEDEYPLVPIVPGDEISTTLVSEFTARTSGELFLYINDAAVLSPRLPWLEFYSNNQGNAALDIKEVAATW
jgi:uncharacterized protein (DUF2235 family)